MHRAATPVLAFVGLSILALAAFGDAALTQAQTALTDVIVVGPGGLCVSVGAAYSHASPPPDGTPLVLATCDGSDAQRFALCGGDCADDLLFARQHIVAERGRAVVRSDAHPTALLRDGAVRFWMGTGGNEPTRYSALSHCLTAPTPPVPGAVLMTRPCDGSAAQAFSSR
jgi:hypothetical protein